MSLRPCGVDRTCPHTPDAFLIVRHPACIIASWVTMTLPAQRADVLAVFEGTGGVHPEDRANTEGVCMLLSDFPKRPGVEDVVCALG